MKKLDLKSIEDYINSFYGKWDEENKMPGLYADMFNFKLTRRIIKMHLPVFINAYDKYFREKQNKTDIFEGSFDSNHREIFRDYLLGKVFGKDTIDLEYGYFLTDKMKVKGYKGFPLY